MLGPKPSGSPANTGRSSCRSRNFWAIPNSIPRPDASWGLAFEMARLALALEDRGDLANEVIANKIIELARTCELNADVLCDAVVKEFRGQHS